MAAGDSTGSESVALRTRVAEYLKAHHTMTLATLGAAPVSSLAAGAVAPAEVAAGTEGRAGIAPRAGVSGAADWAAFSGPSGPAQAPIPHAASVFYAVDDKLRLVFLSKTFSLHGEHISGKAQVAVTVTEAYDDWEKIRGVQMWGEARLLTGAAKAGALALYVSRFPFVRDIIKHPSMAELMRGMGVYRVEPTRVAFTDNLTGVFGREVLDLRAGAGAGNPRSASTSPAETPALNGSAAVTSASDGGAAGGG